ncbi:polysaccharide pyruvyl transferase family protein, partial [Pontibacter sp. BAB1700]|uniref:polysaccharide pyruvyl transferase family protein n=1 Tax=Pontibacter sp. BAB1700 TaxID=1144253 RepID=UPI00026BE984
MQVFRSVNDLEDYVIANLSKHITGDYHLLDTPNYPNAGDQLIWQGQLDFLKSIPFKCLSTSDDIFFSYPVLKKQNNILLQGGGNFGDLYDNHQNFRKNVIKRYKHNRIVMFPQSVHFNNEHNLKKELEVFNSHDELILCARDSYSFDFFNTYCKNALVLLMPDMAFCSKLTLNSKVKVSD